jgi:uncharacterized phage protein (TIGR01671 family)
MLYEGFLKDKSDEDGYYLSISFDGRVEVAVNEDGGKSGLWEHSCSGWEEDFILMQFTGLKDKNGKEIYEGDILRTITYDKTYEVSFYIGSFVLIDKDPGFTTIKKSPIGCYQTDIILEVIGNIYENPELLKEA